MTTEFATIDTEALIDLYGDWVRTIQKARESLERVEMELRQRLEADGARTYPHPRYSCKLEYPTPSIDPTQLYALKELLPPEVISEGFTEAHEETVKIPDKWDLRQVNKWARNYGEAVAKVVEAAKVQGKPRLKIVPSTVEKHL